MRFVAPPSRIRVMTMTNWTTQKRNAKTIDIKMKDGVAPCHFFGPPQKGNRPAVIFYMDGIGIRPALCDMVERLASGGYHVLLPNLYYRSGPTRPFDAATALKEGPERDRLTTARRTSCKWRDISHRWYLCGACTAIARALRSHWSERRRFQCLGFVVEGKSPIRFCLRRGRLPLVHRSPCKETRHAH